MESNESKSEFFARCHLQLSTPGDGDESEDQAVTPLALVFRGTHETSRVIEVLIAPWTMHKLQHYRSDLVQKMLQEYEYLRMVCVGLIEVCSLSSRAQYITHQSPRILLVHINWITMLALVVHFTIRSIPHYFGAAIKYHVAFANASCDCTDNETITSKQVRNGSSISVGELHE